MSSDLPHLHKPWFSRRRWRVLLVFWGGASLVAAVVTLFVSAAEQSDLWFQSLIAQYPWVHFLITPFGVMGIAWCTRRYFPETAGSGVPQSFAALSLNNKDPFLSFRIAFGKIWLTLLGLLSGASIGSAGPTVHIGASIMHGLGSWVRYPTRAYQHGLVVVGSAAGITAAFNAPLAGLVFALETMSKSLESRTNGLVLSAVVIAGLTTTVLLGDYHFFGQSQALWPGTAEAWLAVPLCGVVGGLLGGLFSRGLLYGSDKLAPWLRRYPLRITFALGLLVAVIGSLSNGSSYGTGYLQINQILNGEEIGLLYPVYKLAATLASFFSGIPGGLFAPSLATGAGIGYDLGQWIHWAPLQVMILLGTIAYFSGVIQAPLTALVILLEMSNNRDMILPLLVTAFIASGSSRLVCPQPLFHALTLALIHKQR